MWSLKVLCFALSWALLLGLGWAFWPSGGLVAQAQQKGPLTLLQLSRGLGSDKASRAEKNRLLTEAVRQRGVTFPLTPEIETELRMAGADDALIAAIRAKAPRPTPTPTPKPSPTPALDNRNNGAQGRSRIVGNPPAEFPIAPPAVPSPTPESKGLNLTSYSFKTVQLDRTGKVVREIEGTARSFQENLGGSVMLEMTQVPKGTFMMGSPDTEESRDSDEGPQHLVSVPAFFMGRYEVTQAQYEAVRKLPKVTIDLPANPSYFKGDDLPVERVTWNEAKEFCARLSRKTGRAYRLPTEAEWEYAARAGTTTPFAFGETITPDIVNYDGNYPYADAPKGTDRGKTFAAFSGKANPFGLYNLHGNVYEWTEDEYKDSYEGAPTDGSAVGYTTKIDTANGLRVLRGGSWTDFAQICRSAYRDGNDPANRNLNIGFRVVVPAR